MTWSGRKDGHEWWRHAVIYQVYIRSFADGNGDGVGDIAGIRSRLPYLKDLGVDALWINPWYPSPMADGGYDVSDYRGIAPEFGTLADATEFIDDAHMHGFRVLLDIVPNHTSSAHPWFQAALASAPGSPARQRYHFRPGSGPHGDQPPNDWRSVFGGGGWTRITEMDGTEGEWYLHLFAPEQPDLNWEHPDVAEDFDTTLRFWFERGIDGFRIDVANSLAKAAGLPDVGVDQSVAAAMYSLADHPHWDRDEVHEVYRRWRRIANSYDPPRIFVAEALVYDPERLARYLRADELHTAFNFEFLECPWLAEPLRRVIDATVLEHAQVAAPPTWVLSNHDVARHVSRYARPQSTSRTRTLDDIIDKPMDLALGTRRARAAALLMLALPGCAYIYQGDELGLPEVEDLADDVLQDPTWERSEHTERGRDGCRVPLPWSGQVSPYGFSPPNSAKPPWLPQPDYWRGYTAQSQADDPHSMLTFYRHALRIRRTFEALGDGPLVWIDSAPDVLHFSRPTGFECLVNLSDTPTDMARDSRILISSQPLTTRSELPSDTAVWLSTNS
jgi:alpha-glucosidase